MALFRLHDPKDNIQLKQELLDNHLENTGGQVYTRFPPEPNGYLHIGHVKAICTNFIFAEKKGGKCYLRFDDTNPKKEKGEYIESIINDIKWLGYTPFKITYTSDYFGQLIEFAKQLILIDKAYICELDSETMQKERREGIDSIYRNRPIEESMDLFERMINGEIEENKMTLRMKGSMQAKNSNLRDLVAYRVVNEPHPRTGTSFKVYPTYDFSHCIIDSLEHITHSLCSSEFIDKNELYRWVLDNLEIYKPVQIEYSRLNISNTILSKRKLNALINQGVVDGWTDPRMPTIAGLRKRGYTPESLKLFIEKVGLNFGHSSTNVEYSLLEECLRQDLEKRAIRAMAINNPVKLKLVNKDDDFNMLIDVPDDPNIKEESMIRMHKVSVSNEIYIDANDFRTEDSKKYFRLAPNKIVRLKYLGLIKCTGYTERESGKITEIFVELLPADYVPEKRVKGTINWVDAKNNVKVMVNMYGQLVDDSGKINHDSKKVEEFVADISVGNKQALDHIQFERIGYFCVDEESTACNKVLNFTTYIKQNKYKT